MARDDMMRADDPTLVFAYREMARSPFGKTVLADLRDHFLDRPLAPVVADALTAGIAIGAHDVVRYMIDMIELPDPVEDDNG